MNTILIAGAGQLGSRHLQGVKKSANELDIWVYDLSDDSLRVAKERYEQVESETYKSVHFVKSLDEVPSNIDIAIISSSSKPRYSIISTLLASHSVKYMVLEKFLFPRLSDYDDVARLIKEKNIKTFVNCPRRMIESYDIVKRYIDNSRPISMTHRGQDWGLCCNSIHFIDIFMQIVGKQKYSLNIDGLIPEVIDSKRDGYVELRGTELITVDEDNTLTLTSEENYKGCTDVIINNGDNKIVIQEGAGKLFVNGEEHQFEVMYQSTLSGILVDELISTGTCRLTAYEESSSYHKQYLSVIAPYINKLKGWTSDSCPIT